MAKTTKFVRGIHSLIKFQKHQGIESLTIEGKQALADISQDKNGDANLVFNADKDKVNTVASNVPFLGISHTTTGTDPNQEKTATISQDLTQFPLSGGELVTVTKEDNSLTIHDNKVKEFVNTTVLEKETELKEFVTTTITTKENELKALIENNNGLEMADKTCGAMGGFNVDTSKFIKDFSITANFKSVGVCILYVNYKSAGTEQSFIIPYYAAVKGTTNVNGAFLSNLVNGSYVSLQLTLPTVPTENFNVFLVSYASTSQGDEGLTISGIE